jgi:hypothetical protein
MIVLFSARVSGFEIVSGSTAKSVLVIPKDAPSVSVLAAEEMQVHIEKATGVKLRVVTENSIPDSSASLGKIFIGSCAATVQAGLNTNKMKKNEYAIMVTDQAMFLSGCDDREGDPVYQDFMSMGTLLAVYDWLDSDLGVRWVCPGELGTDVPRKEHITVSPGKRNGQPRFIHTRLRFPPGDFRANNWQGVCPEKVYVNFLNETMRWLRRQRFVRTVTLEYGHAFTDYWARFGETHPEYFALTPEGVRRPVGSPAHVQLCVSNPALHKQIISDWLEARKKNPDIWVNGNLNDYTPKDAACTCEKCKQWDGAFRQASGWPKGTPSLSNRAAKFLLALQQEAAKHDPNASVIGLAYGVYAGAPDKSIKLNDHIVLRDVPPYKFPLQSNPEGKEGIDILRKDWDGWAQTGARMVLRPNYFYVGAGFSVPYIFSHEFGMEFQHAVANGLIATDFDSLAGQWGIQGPMLYLLGRIHVQPEMKVDAILDEYYSAFGPAKGTIKDYFDYWEGVTLACSAKDMPWSRNFIRRAHEFMPLKYYPKAEELLQTARRLTKGNQIASRRVEFLQKGLTHSKLFVTTCEAWAKWSKADPANPERAQMYKTFTRAITMLDAYRNKIAGDLVVEPVGPINAEEPIWKRKEMKNP